MSWKSDALRSARSAARGLRIGLEAQAADSIVEVTGALGAADPDALGPLNELFGAITTAQRRRDLLRLADLLEYELPERLSEVKT